MSFEPHNATPETAVDAQLQNLQKNIHTALPCKVVSFNPQNQTATVAVQIKQVLSAGGSSQIPPLTDVPVSFPRGGGFAVTFPLKAGDEGFVVFSERCIDGWWQSGNASEPLDFRLHDFSDAMFVPGICSVPQAIQSFFESGLSLQTLDSNTFIRITNGKIEIKGDISHTGDTQQTGAFSATGVIASDTDVSAAGISGKSHVHSKVTSGRENSGEPQ